MPISRYIVIARGEELASLLMLTGPAVEIREAGVAASHEGAHAEFLGDCRASR